MKKIVVGCLFVWAMCFISGLFAEPRRVNSNEGLENFERTVKLGSPRMNVGGVEPDETSIGNVVPGGRIDYNRNLFCRGFLLNVEVEVPDEGGEFYLLYFWRIKNLDSGEWSAWEILYEGESWFFSKEDSVNYYLEFLYSIGEEFASGQAQFRLEMYTIDDTLLDTFMVSKRYWTALVESKNNDLLPTQPE